MSADEPDAVPEDWREYFKNRGIEPYFRDLHRKVEDDMSLGTVIRALTGEGTSTNRVVSKLSSELGLTPDKFKAIRSRLAGQRPMEPFRLPDRANQLSTSERAAVMSVVNAILNARTSTNRVAQQQQQQPSASVVKMPREKASPLPPADLTGIAASMGEKESDDGDGEKAP